MYILGNSNNFYLIMKMIYKIGKIRNTHGLKGFLVVKEETDFDRFKAGNEVFMLFEGKELKLVIKDVKRANKGLLVLFKDYEDINLVLNFKGLELYTYEKPELSTDEFHFNDLIKKEVYNQNEKYIGQVIEVIEVPQGHIIRIKTNGESKLVPFNKEFIVSVDDIIIINEISGLLWE